MANRNKDNVYPKEEVYSLSEQKYALINDYPDGRILESRESFFSWTATVKPSPLSKEYTILLEYKWSKKPHVWVNEDCLEKTDNPNFPHRYKRDKKADMVEICLFYPDSDEWTKGKLISKIIIPWAIEWLFHYEIWLSTGKWSGGGIHPSARKIKDSVVRTKNIKELLRNQTN